MSAEKVNIDLHKAKKIIYSLDLHRVVEYLQNEKNWRYESALLGCEQYKNYLYLVIKHSDLKFPPSFEINEVWKAHIIIDTEKYLEFCERIFATKDFCLFNHRNFFKKNRFINTEDKVSFEHITKRLYFDEFNQKLVNINKQTVFFKFIGYLQKKHRWLIGLTFPILLAAFITYASGYNELIENAHKSVEDAARNLTYDEEITYMICSLDDKNKENPFYFKILYDFTRERWKDFFNYINTVGDVHERHLITDDAYNALADYSHWNNELYEAGMQVCKLKLRNFKEINEVRKDLIAKILASEREKSFTPIFSNLRLEGLISL